MSNKTIIGIIMTAILTLGFLLTSCRPDPKDGIYYPKKHIPKSSTIFSPMPAGWAVFLFS